MALFLNVYLLSDIACPYVPALCVRVNRNFDLSLYYSLCGLSLLHHPLFGHSLPF